MTWLDHCDRHYPRCPIKRTARLAEEYGELMEAVMTKERHEVLAEVADAANILRDIAHLYGEPDLQALMETKAGEVMGREEYRE